MKNKTSIFVKILLIIMMAATLAMCIFWLPDTIAHCEEYLSTLEIFDSSNMIALLYAFATVTVAPVFLIFILSFRFSAYIKNDKIFHSDTARLLKLISCILICDCALFIAGTVFLLTAGEKTLSPVFAFVSAIGLTVASMLAVLSEYVCRAAILKEEADYTL